MKENINLVSLYKTTHDLTPKIATKLNYNINSLQLTNHPDQQLSELQELRLQINALAPSRLKYDKTCSNVPLNTPKTSFFFFFFYVFSTQSFFHSFY